MPDIETPDGDALEQQQDVSEPADSETQEPSVAVEASEADAVEQQTPLSSSGTGGDNASRWDADEGDLAESSREVGFDDDDYR